MSHELHSHTHRKRVARIYLAIIFVLLLGTNALLFRLTLQANDLWRGLIGLLLGNTMASMLLVVGVWRRIGWSRYVLIGLNWLILGIFGYAATYLGSEPWFGWRHTGVLFVPPLCLLILINVWLIRSKRIRHLVTPPGSGG